jgi:hypothetical protein
MTSLRILIAACFVALPSGAALAQGHRVTLTIYRRETKVAATQPASIAVEIANQSNVAAMIRIAPLVVAQHLGEEIPPTPPEAAFDGLLEQDQTYGLMVTCYLRGSKQQRRSMHRFIQLPVLSIQPNGSGFLKIEIPSEKLAVGECILQASLIAHLKPVAFSEPVRLTVVRTSEELKVTESEANKR